LFVNPNNLSSRGNKIGVLQYRGLLRVPKTCTLLRRSFYESRWRQTHYNLALQPALLCACWRYDLTLGDLTSWHCSLCIRDVTFAWCLKEFVMMSEDILRRVHI